MDEELPIKTVACHTEGCENASIPLTLPCADQVFCGACGFQITDIQTN